MANKKNSYSEEEILEQLRKITEEEERLYGGRQASISFPDLSAITEKPEGVEFDSDTESLIDNSEDPKLNKKLYYGIMAIINKNIPKGAIRDFVHNEKKLYLKSVSRSSDSKFSFKQSLSNLYEIADVWVRSDTNGLDLGLEFSDLNERSGFHKDRHIKQINFLGDNSTKLNELPKSDD